MNDLTAAAIGVAVILFIVLWWGLIATGVVLAVMLLWGMVFPG